MWPGFSAFSSISSLLNQAIPDKAIPLANTTTMVDESITNLRSYYCFFPFIIGDIATLRRENKRLIDDQALLHEVFFLSFFSYHRK